MGAAERQLQVQSWSFGTPARASSTCMPQPVQVIFPHDEQRIWEHIVESFR